MLLRQIFASSALGMFAAAAFAADPIFDDDLRARAPSDRETPLFVDRQLHLLDAPKGVGAQTAQKLKGGNGENVKIIDIETGLDAEHEDHGKKFYIGDNPKVSDHGTAVVGVLRGVDNAFGVVGIAPAAQLGFHGFIEGELDEVDQAYIDGITKAIRASTEKLDAGDVLVIEQHMIGPDNGKYSPVEYWDEIFKALKEATDKGIYCVEAAGNGNSSLDAEGYKKAFDLKNRNSGCILVGAGDPKTKERLSFSNYGSRIDAFGFGSGVTTTGYGDLFNGGQSREYTARFNGTSSATPIVAGAVALVSSIAKAQGKTITPEEMRAALRATGTPQAKSPEDTDSIGNLPDIDALLKHLKI